MKWLLRGLAVIVVLIVGYSVTANYIPAARIAAICVPAEVLGINLGLIPLDRADWGYLKLRSGNIGLDALRDLERHGATDKIRQTSVAVQNQWLEAGHISRFGGGHLYWEDVQEKETRYAELRMPLDGKTLGQDLMPGQAIPESFWQDYRYRLACLLPPLNYRYQTGECRLSMADLNGDNLSEIILDIHTVGMDDFYIKPAVRHRVVVYQKDGSEWKAIKINGLCAVDQASSYGASLKVYAQKIDLPWINGHAVNFFNSDCFVSENSVPTPASGLSQARSMAPYLAQIQLLPSSKPIPSSLASALSNRSIVLPLSTEPPMREPELQPKFQGLPPCFMDHAPKACVALVDDIDHDGSNDVIILDNEVRKDVSTWRLATLLMMRQGRWTVVANHAACAEEGQKLEDLNMVLKASAWRPFEFTDRLYLPDEPSDSCTDHFLSM